LGIGDDKPSTNHGVRCTQTQDDKLLIQPRHQRIQAGLLVWIDFYHPLNLAILKRSVFDLHGTVSDWETSLPEGETVKIGKDDLPFVRYRNGVLAGMVASSVEALMNIGNIQLFQAYLGVMTENPDNPSA
jgi:hypothetical protein